MKTHELGPQTTRRGALGLLGGFAALAVGAAPIMHEQATLDVSLDIVDYGYADPTVEELKQDETAPDVDDVVLKVTNHGPAFVPLFFTWDQKRKPRHNWEIDRGPSPVPAGETVKYRLVAPGKAGRINAGYPAQITLFEKGAQRWQTVRFTPEAYMGGGV